MADTSCPERGPTTLEASVIDVRRATRDALLSRENPERVALDAVIDYESGEWERAVKTAAHAAIDAERLPEAYTSALRQAHEVVRGGITSHCP